MDTAPRKKIRNYRDNRKYGRRHREVRAEFAKLVAAGNARCARCGELIEPGTPWDAGHDDHQPSLYSGPEHAGCNRGAPHRNVTPREW